MHLLDLETDRFVAENGRFLQQGSNPKREQDRGWGARGEKRENGMSMSTKIGPLMMSIFLLDLSLKDVSKPARSRNRIHEDDRHE